MLGFVILGFLTCSFCPMWTWPSLQRSLLPTRLSSTRSRWLLVGFSVASRWLLVGFSLAPLNLGPDLFSAFGPLPAVPYLHVDAVLIAPYPSMDVTNPLYTVGPPTGSDIHPASRQGHARRLARAPPPTDDLPGTGSGPAVASSWRPAGTSS